MTLAGRITHCSPYLIDLVRFIVYEIICHRNSIVAALIFGGKTLLLCVTLCSENPAVLKFIEFLRITNIAHLVL